MKPVVLDGSKSGWKLIAGSTTEAEGYWLYQRARALPRRGVIVEIGSFLGKSTAALAGGSQSGSRVKVYAVDPHLGSPAIGHKLSEPTYKQFLANINKAKVGHLVEPIKKTSVQAVKGWSRPINLLFVDGDHSIRGVKQDLLAWEPWVLPGGVIALHDGVNPGLGPVRGIVNILLKYPRFSRMGIVDSIFFCTKKSPRGLRSWLNWWFFSNAMKLTDKLLSTRNRFMKQFVVKRWLKRWLTFLTRLKL